MRAVAVRSVANIVGPQRIVRSRRPRFALLERSTHPPRPRRSRHTLDTPTISRCELVYSRFILKCNILSLSKQILEGRGTTTVLYSRNMCCT